MSAFGFETTALEVVEGVDLSGKRALVTGGASGIGVETVRALAKAGAEVTIAVRDVDAGEQVATEIGATERRLPRPGQARLRRGVRRGWDGPLHILVNNAGVMAIQELHAQRRRAGDAVRDQPRRALRARPRPARRAGAGGRADRQRQLVRAPALAGDLRRPQLRVPRLRPVRWPTGSPRPPTCCSRSARPPAGRVTASTPTRCMPGGIATNLQRHTGRELIEQAARPRHPAQDARAGRGDVGAAGGLAGARGRRRPLLRGLRRGGGRRAARRVRRRRRRALRAGRGQRGSPVGAVGAPARRARPVAPRHAEGAAVREPDGHLHREAPARAAQVDRARRSAAGACRRRSRSRSATVTPAGRSRRTRTRVTQRREEGSETRSAAVRRGRGGADGVAVGAGRVDGVGVARAAGRHMGPAWAWRTLGGARVRRGREGWARRRPRARPAGHTRSVTA